LETTAQKRVYERIRSHYLSYAGRALCDECTHAACLKMLNYERPLKNGPGPMPPHMTKWDAEKWAYSAKEALYRFAAGKIMTWSVTRAVRHRKSGESYQEKIEVSDEAVSALDTLIRQNEAESLAKAVMSLRDGLLADNETDEETIQVFDTLYRNTQHFALGLADEDLIRGEKLQIRQAALLELLQREHPKSSWTAERLELRIARLRRFAKRLRESFVEDNLLPFTALRKAAQSNQEGVTAPSDSSLSEENVETAKKSVS
jgi:hypothetical protein